jgi:hypothetical protein
MTEEMNREITDGSTVSVVQPVSDETAKPDWVDKESTDVATTADQVVVIELATDEINLTSEATPVANSTQAGAFSETALSDDLFNTSPPDEKLDQIIPTSAPVAVVSEISEVNEEQPVVNMAEDAPEFQDTSSEQFRELIITLLESQESEFQAALSSMTLRELAMVMEALSNSELSTKGYIRKAGLLRKAFDLKYEAELKLHPLPTEDTKQNADELIKAREEVLEQHSRFNTSHTRFNKRREQFELEQQAQRERNSQQKRELIEQLKQIVSEQKVTALDTVREIQRKWKEIGQPKAEDSVDLIQSFRTFMDQFYQMRERYEQLREEDRKINLAKKEKLLFEIKSLLPADETDLGTVNWSQAYEKLQEIQEQWKQIGATPRGDNERIWSEFKGLVDKFFENRRKFFEQRDQQRGEKNTVREKLLEDIATIVAHLPTNRDEWVKAAESIRLIQEQWRSVSGPGDREAGREQEKRYRKMLDEFFEKRAVFFKEIQSGRADLLKKKEELVLEAEGLKDSSDWKKTADTLKRLQQSWLDTGPDEHKDARKLQRRFRKACDIFFDRRKRHLDEQFKQEAENLAKKQQICDEIEQLQQESTSNDRNARIRELQEAYYNAGPVPYKEREAIDARFYKLIGGRGRGNDNRNNRFRDDDRGGRRNFRDFSNSNTPNTSRIKDSQERGLVNDIFQLEEQISQYQNNIQFFSKSKGPNPMRDMIQKNIDEALAKKEKLEAQLKKLKQQQQENANAE